MRKFAVPAVLAAAVLTSAPALAADLKAVYKAAPPPPVSYNPWDVAIGGAVATDYNFRGISQTDRGAAGFAYIEGRYNPNAQFQWYAGIAGATVKLVTDPSAEIDFYGGLRSTFGAFQLDLGLMYYYYPKEQQQFGGIGAGPGGTNLVTSNANLGLPPYTVSNTDFLEFYAKATYTFNDNFAIGGGVYYTDDWLGLNASGTYAAVNAKFTGTALPNGAGWYVSGEIGKYWFGTGDFFGAPLTLPDYATWNAGIGFTYKAVTLDLRYYDTDASPTECFTLTGDVRGVNSGSGTSNWCSEAYIAKLSFDTTLGALK